jgi:hypothetical protein
LEKLLFELFLKIFSVLVYSHVRCGCIHEDTLLLSLLVDSTLQQTEHFVYGSLAVFPRLKGRKQCLFFLSDFCVALIVIPEL